MFDAAGMDLHMTRLEANIFSSTQSGGSYLTFTLAKRTLANSATTIASFNTGSDADNTFVDHSADIDALLDVSSTPILNVAVTATGSPATHYGAIGLRYRLTPAA